jgi:hypothetical protein
MMKIMKADVEGHELEVFRGGEEVLKQGKIKHNQVEYGGRNIDLRVLLKDMFGTSGYLFYKVLLQELLHVASYDQRLENFPHQNWLLISEEKLGTRPSTIRWCLSCLIFVDDL